MAGISNIKIVLLFIINFGERIEKVTRPDSPGGKKVTWVEVLGFLTTVKDIPELIKSAKELKAEFDDLDSQEKDELIAYVATELDLENDKVEELIEKGWATLVQLSDLVNLFGGK